ncbi:CD302 antigen isoform X3 [Caretta caretta]|uniref:CD302 antigen isoform X3 n=1 Tax=Caretta caretta TaxID=8467 RepID=UPI002095786D|nr:CD302 antigen isoform X4 [Caretta caretta]
MEPRFPALLCLLGLLATASGAAECPSSAWIPFGSSCYIFLQGTLDELDSIDDARNLCKDNASGADIISIKNKEENTFIQETLKNHWQVPDYISLGMFFDTDVAYEKKYLPDKTALTTTLVIIFTIVVTVSAALFWFLYKRNISSASGALCITHNSTAETPYSDETVLIDEENEYTA